MKKIIIMLSLLLCMALLVTGCGGPTKATDSGEKITKDNKKNDDGEDESEGDIETGDIETGDFDTEDIDAEDKDASSKEGKKTGNSNLETIADFSECWNDLYHNNEAVLNAYEGMPIMETVTPGLCFISGIQYDLLNLNMTDGLHEGELMFAGYQGFVEKSGPRFSFGYEDVLEEDGWSPSMKAGDRKVENGTCDLREGYYFTDSFTERDGIKTERSVSEFRIEKDGSMSTIVMDGHTRDWRDEESIRNTLIFIRNGKEQYDIVVAKAEVGPEFDIISLEEDMSKEKAIALFEGAGATIEIIAGIVNNVFTLE